MDLRDLFRNFLGINRRIEPPERGRNYQNRGHLDENNRDENGNRYRDDTRSNDGSDLIFGDMLNTMEDMFKEMEESFSEIDSFFQGLGHNQFGFGNLGPLDQDNFNFNEDLPSLPPPQEKSDANVRDLVLKEPDKVPVINKSERMDRDLDDLFSNSALPLSEIPKAPSEPPGLGNQGTGQVTQRPTWNTQSSFERVFSTQSFRNGIWEGKTVRENKDGKEITTYTRNANGEQEETTEFIPNTNNSTSFNNNGNNAIRPFDEGQHFNPFQIFERLFKPRM